MKSRAAPPTAERIRELIDYDQVTGIFRWKIRRSGVRCGAIAGGLDAAGYRQISFDGGKYRAHQLAWAFVYGQWPTGPIDHKDTHRDHNWISNLRLASQTQNLGNCRRRRDNTSGLKGVTWNRDRSKWQAQIQKGGRRIYLGCFDSADEAGAAYAAAAQEAFGEFARTA